MDCSPCDPLWLWASRMGQLCPVHFPIKQKFLGNIRVMFSDAPLRSVDGSHILSSLGEQGLIWKHELRAHCLNNILQIPCKQATKKKKMRWRIKQSYCRKQWTWSWFVLMSHQQWWNSRENTHTQTFCNISTYFSSNNLWGVDSLTPFFSPNGKKPPSHSNALIPMKDRPFQS